MKRACIICALVLVAYQLCYARHIKGGEISYSYVGPGSTANTQVYSITLRLFLECNASGQQLDPDANIGIFRTSNELPVPGSPFICPLVRDEFINLTTPNPCISSPSPVCYRLRVYTSIIELPIDQEGYTLVFQRCCRINGLINLSPSGNIGSSYTCRMGGTDVLQSETNSSPAFAIKDTVLICQNRPFALDFSAEDADGDILTYEFCDAYTAQQGTGGGGVINPSPPGQLRFVTYGGGFSGQSPLGSGVTINNSTGLISGIAPGGGDYVISVCVREWRNGKIISEHRKDFNIQVDQRCDLAAAELKPTYTNCDDFVVGFQNESPPSALIHTYSWDFGDNNFDFDTSNAANPVYRYTDTGVYKLKLIINKGEQCSDSAESEVRIFPGFFTGFIIAGSCIQLPYTFTDTSKTRYGTVNSWTWNFGDETTQADSGRNKSNSWEYTTAGQKPIALIVGSSKGCVDTVFKMLDVKEKPLVNLAFRDTLICSIDTLQLMINGPGNYLWIPNYNIVNPTVSSPLVFPKQTTVYVVNMNDNGCVNSDSVRVRVVDFVSLNAGTDTTICLTDSVRLNPITDGLRFQWSPTTTINNSTVKRPIVFPLATTSYRLTANIGKCSTTDEVIVKTVPYPFSNAGNDTVACFEDTVTLNASITGSRFQWLPATTLGNAGSLNTIAFPKRSTVYSLYVYDTLGCPKPGISDVLVTVRSQIFASAGNDTSIVLGQPLQLRATGAELFEWKPSTYLSNQFSQRPIANLPINMEYQVKAFTGEGCFALDTINIKVFKTAPDIFVPNAFRPGGRNAQLRPVPVGISTLEYFRVFNRWGQLVYQTSATGKGWDGTIGGKQQPTGTYVWQVRGKDYTGKIISRTGTAVLIR
ncbi:MAG: gliding motility-associated C-terminal domain-containing protein [Chitinophagaceae bacterium]|nr:gliding motility-associated C-terminal domain-containing protein [Chitinophagaceae bacterium]